jgi:hypothetical protein
MSLRGAERRGNLLIRACTFRGLLRFASNDRHSDALASTMRFASLTSIRRTQTKYLSNRRPKLKPCIPENCSIDFSLFVFYCPNVGCLKLPNFTDGPRPVWKYSFYSRYRRIRSLVSSGLQCASISRKRKAVYSTTEGFLCSELKMS